MSNSNLFILAGNGPYDNRGCEAIVRGTVEIISRYFQNSRFLVCSNFFNKKQLLIQQKYEFDKRISHTGYIYSKRYSLRWICENFLERSSSRLFREYLYRGLLQNLSEARAVLSIGGDTYSLDYGLPKYFVYLNDLIIAKKKPFVIWGASIGPFSNKAKYEKYITEHFRKIIIFARECETIDYLYSKGIKENVYKVADPAFIMKAQAPMPIKLNFKIKEGGIGINLSPLLAKYITNGDMNHWINMSAEIIKLISTKFKRPIYLIPHVTVPNNDDYLFMKNVLFLLKKQYDIILVPPIFNAAETKWIIGKMHIFVGARTHSIISALSMFIPSLSLGYSLKAKGINRDIFGHFDYCIPAKDLKLNIILEKINLLLVNRAQENEHLKLTIPRLEEISLQAGKYLKYILKDK